MTALMASAPPAIVMLDGIRYRIVDAIKVATPLDKVTWEHSRATVTDGGVLRYVAARLEKVT